MKRAYATIGATWGDEGKGNATDIICSRVPEKTINVRFNGGAQASHTVVTPDGKRHAFRHFGSGTFAGSPTYLSKEFMVNIFTFDMEWCELEKKFEVIPNVCVHPQCRITTFWDIYINQMIETMRGENRNGSCGFGINETVHRSKSEKYGITVTDLFSEDKLLRKLEVIQNEYVPLRIKNKYGLEMSEIPKEFLKKFEDKKLISMTIDFARNFTQKVTVMDDSILDRFDIAVFEGAQGLLLDQGYKRFWPNVTTSNTGIKNVIEILENTKFNGDLEIYYISRCYATRHGRGEFPTETPEKPYSKIVDLTNVPNEFQESMRFGILDLDLIIEAINGDLGNLNRKANINIVFTCFNHLDCEVRYQYLGKVQTVSKTHFLKEIRNILLRNISGLGDMYVSENEKRTQLVKI